MQLFARTGLMQKIRDQSRCRLLGLYQRGWGRCVLDREQRTACCWRSVGTDVCMVGIEQVRTRIGQRSPIEHKTLLQRHRPAGWPAQARSETGGDCGGVFGFAHASSIWLVFISSAQKSNWRICVY